MTRSRQDHGWSGHGIYIPRYAARTCSISITISSKKVGAVAGTLTEEELRKARYLGERAARLFFAPAAERTALPEQAALGGVRKVRWLLAWVFAAVLVAAAVASILAVVLLILGANLDQQLIEAHARVSEVTIAWQGGEPTLAGVEFFRRWLRGEAAERNRAHAVAGSFDLLHRRAAVVE